MKKLISIMAVCLLAFGFAATATAAEGDCGNCAIGGAGQIARGCETTVTTQTSSSCMTEPFDFEDCQIPTERSEFMSGLDYSYCDGKGCSNRAWFDLCNCFPDLASGQTISISMEILVDKNTGTAVAGDNNVYWAEDVGTVIPTWAYRNQLDACADTTPLDPTMGFTSSDGFIYKTASGLVGSTYAGTNCSVADLEKVVKIETDYNSAEWGMLTVASKGTLWIDIPAMRVVPSAENRGRKVYVQICIIRGEDPNIGQPICDDCCCLVYIGELCCDEDPAVGKDYCIMFPYLPAVYSANWWFGLSLNNLGSSTGLATITMYEKDGDVSTGTIELTASTTLPIQTTGATGLESFMALTSGADWGDEPCYIKVTAPFSISGFTFIGSKDKQTSGYTAIPCCGQECYVTRVSESD